MLSHPQTSNDGGSPGITGWGRYYFAPGILDPRYKAINQNEETLNTSNIIYIAATLISILASISMYRQGKRELVIFVGLWALTILDLG